MNGPKKSKSPGRRRAAATPSKPRKLRTVVTTAQKDAAPALSPRHVTLPDTPTTRKPATPNNGVVHVAVAEGENQQDFGARVALHSGTQNAFIAKAFIEGHLDPEKGLSGPLNIGACVEQIVHKLERVDTGNLREMEHMLVGQAAALQTIFTEMARRAAQNMGSYIGATETYMRMALKAQAQCRHTIETLAEIKNPRPIYINPKQVNHSNGPQQINNAGGPQQVNNEAAGAPALSNEPSLDPQLIQLPREEIKS